ncbi:hypothetical protein ACFLRZ_00345 [Bacteroidota bacterium]
MKKAALISLITCLFIIITTCKKDQTINGISTFVPCNSPNNTFIDTLNEAISPRVIIENNQGNILILGSHNQHPKVVLLDSNGGFKWAKEYTLYQADPIDIIEADNNSYLMLSAEQPKFVPKNPITAYSNVWAWANHYLDMNNNCLDFYELSSGPFITQGDNISKSYIQKISDTGNLLWTKEINGNYFPGKAICNKNGNYYFITYKSYGFVAEPLFDTNNIFQDTIKYPHNKNIITLHKMSSAGVIIWEKDITNVIDYAQFHVSNGCDLTLSLSNIFIRSQRSLYVFDLNGNLISSYNPVSSYCENITKGMDIDNNAFLYIVGREAYYTTSSTYPNTTTYLAKINSLGNIHWRIDDFIVGNKDHVMTASCQNGGVIYRDNDHDLTKFSSSGNLLWKKSFAGIWIYCFTITCNNRIVMVNLDQNNEIIVIKTDPSGNY